MFYNNEKTSLRTNVKQSSLFKKTAFTLAEVFRPLRKSKRIAFTLAEVFHPLCKSKRIAFTLAEVLITLGIIGIVAVIILPTLITNIQNKGYAERMKKAYSVIQNVTNQIINEEGLPSNWPYGQADTIEDSNQVIVDMYASKMNFAKNCGYSNWYENSCILSNTNYRFLNGQKMPETGNVALADRAHSILLSDGTVIVFKFKNSSAGGFWGANPDLIFIVDVNGKKKPNQIGRDIFYFYINGDSNGGKVYPYGDPIDESCYVNNQGYQCKKLTDDCNKDDNGLTCAYKILIEGKMNY